MLPSPPFSNTSPSAPIPSDGQQMLIAGCVGLVAGLGATAFLFCMQLVSHYALAAIAGYVVQGPAGEHAMFRPPAGAVFSPLWLLVVITIGGLLSGLLVFSLAPEAEGHGTDAAIDSFHRHGGTIRARIPLVKMIASAITIGTGGSAGREGPIAQIGAGFGSLLGGWLKLGPREQRIMLAAGMGAGVGAIFRAPMAGAIFAGEILYRDADIETEVIIPAMIATFVAYVTYALSVPAAFRFQPMFGPGIDFRLDSYWELIPLGVMACGVTVAAIAYIHLFHGTIWLVQRVPGPRHLHPALGGLLAGLAALAVWYAFDRNEQALAVLANGYGALQVAIDNPGQLGFGLLLTIGLVKMLTTSFSVGSGGSGGVFGPSIVIGGCLGAAVGLGLNQIFPGIVRHPQIFALTGMAGFFTACAHAPISTILMISEITGDYHMLLPSMWVASICFLLNRRFTLYVKQVPTRADSPVHRGQAGAD